MAEWVRSLKITAVTGVGSSPTLATCETSQVPLEGVSGGFPGVLPFHPIRLTCPCNVYPLTPHFYIVKLGFTGVYIIFLFLL